MGNIDDFRAKQQELLSTQEQLRNDKAELEAELNSKRNQLESARLENEDKKSELIEQLLSEIDALKENAKNYEQQIESINAELNTLRTNFNSINQTTSQQTVDEQTTSQQTVDEQTTSQQTIDEQTTSQQTVDEQTTSQQTVDEQTTAQQTVDEQTTSQQTVDEQTTAQQTVDEQTTSQQTVDDQITSQQTVDDQTTSQQTVDEQPDIKLDSYEGYNKALSQLIFEIDGCTATAKYKRGLNKSGKETLKTAKAKLKQYKDIINDKKRMLEHEFKQKNKLNAKNPDKVPLTVSISASEINGLKKRRGDRRKVIEEDIKAGQRGESSNIAPRPNQSLEQVIKGNKVDTHHNEYDSKLNEALNDAAFLRIIDNNQDKAREFLQAIANNSLSNQQITFCQTHMVQLSPYFTQYGMMPQVYRCIQTHGGRIERAQGTIRTSADYRNLDRGEAFKQGGLAGIVDKALSNCNNLTPGQRETWKNIAVLGGYAAGIYGLFKFFTSDQKRWKKAGITAAVIFGTQTLTGENPFSLFQKAMTGGLSWDDLSSRFGNAFGDAVDGVQNSGIESGTELSGAMYSLMVFNETATVGEIRGRSTKFKNDPQSWTQFCQTAKEKIGAKHFEKFSAVFSENFDENKWNERLNSIGIHDGIDNNKLIYEIASYKTMNTIIINKFLSDNGVKVTDEKTKKEEFEQYKKSCNDNNQTIDINTLEAHKKDGSWFKEDLEATYTDREIDIENIKQLEAQVEALSLDSQKKSELKIAVKRFYDERSIESKPNVNDFNLKMESNLLILTSHKGHEAKINLSTNEIENFGKGITFSSLSDLLNTADIANKVLESQKGKLPKDIPPFEYKIGKKGRGIYFNDADFLSLNFDTRVLSGGWGGKMGEIETLSKNPEDYAKYLSERWVDENEINVDSTLYPTVKALSDTGIKFFNEQEVKDLEAWLKSIKEGQKFSVGTTNGEPYKISRRFTNLSNKLVFTAVNGDDTVFQEDLSSKFPTIMRKDNQSKFENFMNNKKNGMRGSAIN